MSDDKNDDDFDFSSTGKDGEFENIDDLEELDDLDDFGDLDDIEVIEEGDPEPLVQADKTARKEELHADSVDEDGFASDSLEDDLDDGGMYDVDGEGWDDEESDVMAQAQGAPKKKKSSLVMVLGILVLVGGAGAAYYFTQMAPADKPTPRTPTQTQMDPAAQDQAAVQERPSGFLNDPDLLEDDELNSDIALSREDTGAVPQPLPQPQPSVGIPDQLRGDRFNPNDTDEGGLPQPQPVNNNNGEIGRAHV